MSDSPGKLYSQLASWWPLLSDPADYKEEAQFFYDLLNVAAKRPFESLLELGAGGGHLASHLKTQLHLTLSDRSPEMLAVCRSLNPECEHIVADMRTARLDRQFDAVLIHDAIMYITSEPELGQTLETAWIHCRPGGIALFSPDFIRETFSETTSHGGHDQGERALRYLEWTTDPDPSDTQYSVFFVYVLRDGAFSRVESEEHLLGLFPRQVWLDRLRDVGFIPRIVRDPSNRDVFLCEKPG
jgi:SAM-dependent methyltransferase